MDKQDYFNRLLKRDFVRYVLLKEPEYSDREISAKLKSEIDADRLYERMKRHIPELLQKHLSPAKLKDQPGKVADVLPEGINPEIAETIKAEFNDVAKREYSAVNFMPSILAQIERLTWAQGIDDMAQNLRRFVADLKRMSAHQAGIYPIAPTHYRLKEKFEAAMHISARERIMKDNDKDVADFIEALTEYSRDLCGVELSLILSKLYAEIAESKEIADIIDRFDRIGSEARKEMESSLKDFTPVTEWEDEYNRLFPMDFYERNVEGISAAKAFQMVLLLTLSHHEKELRVNGYIDDNGELRFFINERLKCIADYGEIVGDWVSRR